MLKIEPPDYQFCPFCRKKLEVKIKEKKERKFCPSCNWTYYPEAAIAVVAVIVRENKTLMVKRAKEPYLGTWMFPAGFVDFGEHPKEALAREIKEETGMLLKKAKFLEIMQAVDDPRNPGHLAIFYKVVAGEDGEPTDEEENSDIGWFDIQNPPEIGWKGHKQIMKALQEEQKKAVS